MTTDLELLQSKCQDRCGKFGDPPCYELDGHGGQDFKACAECLDDLEEERRGASKQFREAEVLDETAVIRPLL